MKAPVSDARMEQIAARYGTIADKTRALTDAGYSISEIAKGLERSYQQIRQVVKHYEMRKMREGAIAQPSCRPEGHRRTTDEGPGDAAGEGAIAHLPVREDGSVQFTARMLRRAGIAPGESATAMVTNGEIVLRSAASSMRRAQELVQALLPGDDSLAESLLADRRREAARENADG